MGVLPDRFPPLPSTPHATPGTASTPGKEADKKKKRHAIEEEGVEEGENKHSLENGRSGQEEGENDDSRRKWEERRKRKRRREEGSEVDDLADGEGEKSEKGGDWRIAEGVGKEEGEISQLHGIDTSLEGKGQTKTIELYKKQKQQTSSSSTLSSPSPQEMKTARSGENQKEQH